MDVQPNASGTLAPFENEGPGSDTKPGNWIAVDRNMINHPKVGAHVPAPSPADPALPSWTPNAAWLWCVGKAAHCNRTVTVAGLDYHLERGEFVASRNYLASVFNWTPKTVRVFVANRQKDGMLAKVEGPGWTKNGARGKGQGPNVFKVQNYDKYQTARQAMGPGVRASLPPKVGPQDNNKLNNTYPPTPSDAQRDEANRLAREAMIGAQARGSTPRSGRAEQTVRGELDGRRGIEFSPHGEVIVTGEAAAILRAKHPGVDLAAVGDRAGPDLAALVRKGHPSYLDAMALLRKWARIVADDDAKRRGGPGNGARGRAPLGVSEQINRIVGNSASAGASL